MSSKESTEVAVVTAASVDEAIILGLTRLVATRDEVDIEVLDEGSRGFLGIGMREARVRVTRRAQEAEPSVQQAETESSIPEPEPATHAELEPAEVAESKPAIPEAKPAPVPPTLKSKPETTKQTTPSAEEVTAAPESIAPAKPVPKPTLVEQKEKPCGRSSRTLDRAQVEKTALEIAENLFAGFNIQYSTSWEQEDRPALWISLRGKDANVMVGPRAQTLNSIQYLFRTLLHRMMEGDYNVVIDADGYRKRRQRSLESLAHKLADKAIKSGRTVRMKPMPAHERRLIHMLLRKDKRVKTESTGRGHERAITIIPSKKEP
ncbi:MAG: Jag N-terminal domain-containing protein [Anaerolineae bacterium]|nr:Jag N-terminal domain-containing protein [Anaerolineae bacterium]